MASSVKSVGSPAQLLARLQGKDPATWLLVDLPPASQAIIAYDRMFAINELTPDAFRVTDFANLTKDQAGLNHYVWIEIGQTNEVIVVGRTKFDPTGPDYGDLFKNYTVSLGKSADAIAQVVYGDNYQAKVTAPLTELEKQINQYVKGAVIIPLNAPTSELADRLETEIGDAIVAEYGALNPYSHRYNQSRGPKAQAYEVQQPITGVTVDGAGKVNEYHLKTGDVFLIEGAAGYDAVFVLSARYGRIQLDASDILQHCKKV